MRTTPASARCAAPLGEGRTAAREERKVRAALALFSPLHATRYVRRAERLLAEAGLEISA
jgi:hypothetical protein